jgi:hypothetical protein
MASIMFLQMPMPMDGMCWMCALGWVIGIGVIVLITVLIVTLVRK